MRPTSDSPIFRMGSGCFPPRRRQSTLPHWHLASQSLLPGGPLAWGWRSSTFPGSLLWKPQAGGNIGCRRIDPRALREWAMAPTAIALGLRPTHPEERARTPQRTRVTDVILEDKTLSSMLDEATTAIASQSPNGALRSFLATIATRLLGSHSMCAVAALPPTVGAVIPYWSQEAVVAAFCSLYPPHYFENFCFPMVEDLVNQPPFTCFTQWLRAQPWAPLGRAVGPDAGFSPPDCWLALRKASRPGRCRGRRACPPLLPFGLSCEQP